MSWFAMISIHSCLKVDCRWRRRRRRARRPARVSHQRTVRHVIRPVVPVLQHLNVRHLRFRMGKTRHQSSLRVRRCSTTARFSLHHGRYHRKHLHFKCRHQLRSKFLFIKRIPLPFIRPLNRILPKVLLPKAIIFNRIDLIRLIRWTAQRPTNPRTAVTADTWRVFPVSFLSLFVLRPLIFDISRLDYYKLNRLYKALAIQKLSLNNGPPTRGAHHQRRAPGAGGHGYGHHHPHHPHYHPQPPPHALATHHVHPSANIPSTSLSSSPPTPTPMNINQLTPFYPGQSPFLPMPTPISDSRKSKF